MEVAPEHTEYPREGRVCGVRDGPERADADLIPWQVAESLTGPCRCNVRAESIRDCCGVASS